ncbi:MAG TPA: metallophosphoesterase [Candidatus Omnitrophota bacterium]|jgi:putative phosphoesterase|nr:metallophosphoesterase [Candidatus Omnitrophota bacterium]HSA30564.1 metallophosphoesterase [Candidatus Omnitrophota bacterium]
MKIGVVADTHSKKLPPQLIKDFKSVDLIIHAGDICDESGLKQLQILAEVKGVCGNMDDQKLGAMFPERCILTCEDCRIGVVHGQGPKGQVLKFVQETFRKEKVDVVVFGHTHTPCQETVGSVLYFNPGSPTDDIFAPYRSYGILEISGKDVRARIIKVDHHG